MHLLPGILLPGILLSLTAAAISLTTTKERADSLGIGLSTGFMVDGTKHNEAVILPWIDELMNDRNDGALSAARKLMRIYWAQDLELAKAVSARFPNTRFMLEVPSQEVLSKGTTKAEWSPLTVKILNDWAELADKVDSFAVANEPAEAGRRHARLDLLADHVQQVIDDLKAHDSYKTRMAAGEIKVSVPWSMNSFSSTYPTSAAVFVEPKPDTDKLYGTDGGAHKNFANGLKVSEKNGYVHNVLKVLQAENMPLFIQAYSMFNWDNQDIADKNFFFGEQASTTLGADCSPSNGFQGMMSAEIEASRYAVYKLLGAYLTGCSPSFSSSNPSGTCNGVWVTESGWPSGGTRAASTYAVGNSQRYTDYLRRLTLFGEYKGKDHYKTAETLHIQPERMYLFQMFDESKKGESIGMGPADQENFFGLAFGDNPPNGNAAGEAKVMMARSALPSRVITNRKVGCSDANHACSSAVSDASTCLERINWKRDTDGLSQACAVDFVFRELPDVCSMTVADLNLGGTLTITGDSDSTGSEEATTQPVTTKPATPAGYYRTTDSATATASCVTLLFLLSI